MYVFLSFFVFSLSSHFTTGHCWSVNDWQKERQFKKLHDKEERGVHVIWGGVELVIDVKELVVGDIAFLEPGEIIPCDGVFLTGHNVRCDESSATGESDAIRKVGWAEWTALREKEKISSGGMCFSSDDVMVILTWSILWSVVKSWRV